MKATLRFFALMGLLAAPIHAQQDLLIQSMADMLAHEMVLAEVLDDYNAFILHGTPEFKAALTKNQFDASSQILSPRLKQEHEMTSLGVLNEGGFQVYLFRIRFKAGGDDILVTLSLKNGEVSGFYFK